MPDWSYHPLLRPASCLLPRRAVRPFTLKALAFIAALPGGGRFIELLGHMNPPPSLRRQALGMDVASPIGLASGVDDPRIARGPLASPREVLGALSAGAELVLLDAGFVAAGPGLPMRVNEALAGNMVDADPPDPIPTWRQGWPWIALLGAGMAIAGLVVLVVGLTTVTLPYDESFLGLSHRAIAALNPRLISFMKHDRVTLAGTMISLGVLYAGLALGGMRSGATWPGVR